MSEYSLPPGGEQGQIIHYLYKVTAGVDAVVD
jgi:hypothetical protein